MHQHSGKKLLLHRQRSNFGAKEMRFGEKLPTSLGLNGLSRFVMGRHRTRIKKLGTRRELEKAFSIRLRVFVREQRVPRDIELDRDDGRAVHYLAFVGGKAVGTARVVIQRREAKIGRMAVLKSYRGKGVGKALLRRAVSLARKKDVTTIFLNAQVPVIGFYEKLGFCCVGRSFAEAGILHRKMTLLGKMAS